MSPTNRRAQILDHIRLDDLATSVKKNSDDLEYLFKTYIKDQTFNELKVRINQGIEDGSYGAYWIKDTMFFMGDRIAADDPCYTPLLLWMIFTILIEHVMLSDKREDAWPMLCLARYYAGDARTYFYLKNSQVFDGNRRESASRGGKARSEQHSGRAKKQAIILVKELRPQQGWSSEHTAIKRIVGDLKQFCIDRKIKLKPEGLQNNLKRWLKNDEDFRYEFKVALRE
ncbi:hypothetical protein Undi14_04550 [Undibacterium sp. 14-3-2]|uniref:hypothetical protein n=1 Tax=Undibacterium sp. 14-3-2 TaxID=2800129 RepID=UPI0019035474|nr:hypothetical protein [Undibacterium sp. 14-3-2]MBK1889292.1 hypothetical protein [Undibacterium sp. 14-3-2]